ncbi:hypothetical protein PSA7680_00492 [Pseudoruegeria aquimaris]|uniref:Uncharacterized protein n=1 Tax=Pseudoruegeria aquimaris TaxID=393663 RepID=A0A1Y5RG83_9RHOB|nr:hypothetical protein [Pseudoruegeria aquimaris]SLN16747.1 hypothetical protein PSA7680_00492 [Pseudoruegeria aquimaris]
MAGSWHILREEGRTTIARRLPPRFDIAARTDLPCARHGRLAMQIRQDLWRCLRNLRGFSPVVSVQDTAEGVRVTAGGQVDARSFPRAQAEARIAELLASAPLRARWSAHAQPLPKETRDA